MTMTPRTLTGVSGGTFVTQYDFRSTRAEPSLEISAKPPFHNEVSGLVTLHEVLAYRS